MRNGGRLVPPPSARVVYWLPTHDAPVAQADGRVCIMVCKTALLAILSHVNRQADTELTGLAWPAESTIAHEISQTPERTRVVLRQLADWGILRNEGATVRGHTIWYLKVDALAGIDPLHAVMLDRRLRSLGGLTRNEREVVMHLARFADFSLTIRASYRQTAQSLPWKGGHVPSSGVRVRHRVDVV